MSSQNFQYAGTLGTGGVGPATKTFAVDAGAVQSINLGDLVVVTAGLAAKVANAGMASAGKYGLAVSNSTDTVGADGTVDVMFTPVGLIVTGTASGIPTEANLFTPFKINVSSGVQTVDLSDVGVATLWSPTPLPSATTQVQIVLPWAV